MSIANVIGWKFSHQPGMRCKEIDGVMEIIGFPGGIPSQADQDTWTAEYDAHILANPPVEQMTVEELFDVLVTRGLLNTTDRPTRP